LPLCFVSKAERRQCHHTRRLAIIYIAEHLTEHPQTIARAFPWWTISETRDEWSNSCSMFNAKEQE